MDQIQYLQLKIVNLEFKQVCAKAESIVQTARAKYNEALLRAGLEPSENYIMDDATSSITPVPRNVTPPSEKEA